MVAVDDTARRGDPSGDDLRGDARNRLLARRVDGQQHHFVGMRQRLGELRMEVARTGVEVGWNSAVIRRPGNIFRTEVSVAASSRG